MFLLIFHKKKKAKYKDHVGHCYISYIKLTLNFQNPLGATI